MSKYALRIENDIVVDAIVCDNPEWAIQKLGGEWIAYDTKIGIGWERYEINSFREPQPYPSWTWVNDKWVAPVPSPEGDFVWNEETQSWIESTY